MRRIHRVAAGLATAAAIATFVACSSDSGTGVGRTAVSLAGNYGLDSLSLGVLGTVTDDSGTLALTADSVHANITVITSPNPTLLPNNTTLNLTGVYQAWHTSAGDSVYFILVSPPGTFPGTFAIKGAQQDSLALSLFVTIAPSQSILVSTRWHKK